MTFSSKPVPPWRESASTPAPSAPGWRSPVSRQPYRMRWWKLAGTAIAGMLALAAATWAVFWIRPPDPAHLVVLAATYDNTLAVPSHPYGKAGARELAELAKPGGWLGTKSRLHGGSKPARFGQLGLADLSAVREPCIVVAIQAHGGRDRDGAFLFPEDATSDQSARVRMKSILSQLGKLPPAKHKLLILDATVPVAYTELGLVNNDFATALEELDADIAAVPNLAVFMSTGADQRSWSSPEWGTTGFMHFVVNGLKGAADSNGDKRISGMELVDYVTPRVKEWARDHCSALQTPVLLPSGSAGRKRLSAMHLAMTDGPPPEEAAPRPFDPPPELDRVWQEYRQLALAYPPPTAYTPHLWRQYQAWTLRYEQAVIAGDGEGEATARAKASELKRQIEAARPLEISPQTLALQAGLGGVRVPKTVPEYVRTNINHLAALPAAERQAAWAGMRNIAGVDANVGRILWCKGLVEWAALDPLTQLPRTPPLVSLITDDLPVRPAEINFLVMLAKHLPAHNKSEAIGPLLKSVLQLRLAAEEAAEFTAARTYPFPEWLGSYAIEKLQSADASRRSAEDLCFATKPADWQTAADHLALAERDYGARVEAASAAHDLIATWHLIDAELPAYTEWLARDPYREDSNVFYRELLFQAWRATWSESHEAAAGIPRILGDKSASASAALRKKSADAAKGMRSFDSMLSEQVRKLLSPESEVKRTSRAAAVAWWQSAGDVLTAPHPISLPVETRRKLILEYCRVSRQLQVTGRTWAESLPEVTPETMREQAFAAARRRGLLLVDRLHVLESPDLNAGDPGITVKANDQSPTPEYRFNHFAFHADARQWLAEAGSQCGELIAIAIENAKKTASPTKAELWLRVVPAHADVSDALLDRRRRERVQALLVQQAQRTYLDQWYGDGGTRYYRSAIERLAHDARPLGSDPKAAFAPYLGTEPPFPIAAKIPFRFAITDEPHPELTVSFSRQAAPDLTGVPVFWSSQAGKTDARLSISLDAKQPLPTLVRPIDRLTSPPPRFPQAEKSPVQVMGFFRGRIDEKTVPVEIYRLPDNVSATAPALKSAAIALRADPNIQKKFGLGVGAVAIVLDCSGSVGPVDRKNPLDRGLYPKSLEALKRLVSELPPGTILNVWVFGERKHGEKVAPEETIREVLEPTELDFDRSEVLKIVMDDVSALEPWDMSPIVRAVTTARDRIQNVPVPFKSVVLISDGVDTRYDHDEKNLKKRSVKDALRAEFPPHGVSLSLLALPASKEEAGYQAEFQIVNDFKPAGKFLPIERVDELIAWLRNGLNPRVRFTLEPLAGQLTRGDLTAGTDASDNWYTGRLEPGTYRFEVQGAGDFTRNIRLDRGDRLLLDLTENRGAMELKRHWSADTAAGVKSGKPTDPWRLTLMQNRSEAGGLKLFATIEDRPAATDPVSALHIGDVWMEVRPVLPNPGPVSVRFRSAPGFPSPSWDIELPGWPAFPGSTAAASPAVEAWWNPGEPFPAVGVWQPPMGKPIASLAGESGKFGDAAVTISSIGMEDHAVDGKAEPQRCLVVRLAHPPGSPVWVRPQGARPAGSEVRAYRGANSTTCLFWGIDSAAVTGFDVVVLNAAIEKAEQQGCHAILDTVPAPMDSSPRPEPPVAAR